MSVLLIKETILLVICLSTIVSASKHAPQVHEEHNDRLHELVRNARHSSGVQMNYFPPAFHYQPSSQQDRLRAKYLRQQTVDILNLKNTKMFPINADAFFELQQQSAVHKPAHDFSGDDWKPFQPRHAVPKANYKKTAVPKRNEKNVLSDLNFAGSEVNQENVPAPPALTSDQDENTRFIYVQPSLLSNNLGIEPKAASQILKNAAPQLPNIKPNEVQLSELESLLGKNPELQLEGLQRILGDDPVLRKALPEVIQKEFSPVFIEHNGSPSGQPDNSQFQSLQEQLDAVNKARSDALLAAAQKQAEEHVKAQHKAIELAQKQAEEEVLAKIAAHNNGGAPINTLELPNEENFVTPESVIVSSETPQGYVSSTTAAPEVLNESYLERQPQELPDSIQVDSAPSAPESLPLQGNQEELVIPHSVRYNTVYAPSYNEPKVNITSTIPRGRVYQPVHYTKTASGSPKLHIVSNVPTYQKQVYAPEQEQNYIPLPTPASPVIVQSVQPHITAPEPNRASVVQLAVPPLTPTRGAVQNHLYSKEKQYSEVPQYAAKYAFGYRVVDEQTGNDFGHEEERDGENTKGHYFVLLPDGRRQKVDYYVDNHGYHARVSYDTVARHTYLPPQQREEPVVEDARHK
ncbi:uncharacterized protein LOC115881433 [Sitophilus oryzae]|uniref:Uncharacterized protein LOC115881433 n=1 Tax=Sitophilus oryzae TaxID=7048 RepID=A0A6J2XVI9_SITOR|nr:uncharacterized protein LOC115881433 [Sitophilus oryzae]